MQFSLNHTDKINLSYKVIYISGTDRLHISPSLHWLYAPLCYSKTGFSQSKRVWTHCKLLILKYFFYCFPLMFLCWGSRVLMCRILNVSILEGIKIRRGKKISLKFVLEQMRLMSVLCLAGFAVLHLTGCVVLTPNQLTAEELWGKKFLSSSSELSCTSHYAPENQVKMGLAATIQKQSALKVSVKQLQQYNRS